MPPSRSWRCDPTTGRGRRLCCLGALLAVWAFLLSGCAEPTREEAIASVMRWASQAESKYSGLRVDTTYPPPHEEGETRAWGVLAHVTVADRTAAEEFVGDFRKRVRNLGRPLFVDARVTWPVSGGTTVLNVSLPDDEPDGLWDQADLPLPPSVSERRLGWSTYPQMKWAVDRNTDVNFIPVEELVTDDPRALAQTELTGPFEFVLTTAGGADWGSFLGPGTRAELARQNAELTMLDAAGIALDRYLGRGAQGGGGDVRLAARDDLDRAIGALEGRQWWVSAGPITFFADDYNGAYRDVLPALAGAPGLTTAVFPPDRDGPIPQIDVDAPHCADMAALLPPGPRRVNFSCGDPASHEGYWLSRTPAEVAGEAPILERARELGAARVVYSTGDQGMELTVRLRPAAGDEQWSAALRELRELAWEGEATVKLELATDEYENLRSTAAGTVPGSSALIDAWNASVL